jgi:hypothetical protein
VLNRTLSRSTRPAVAVVGSSSASGGLSSPFFEAARGLNADGDTDSDCDSDDNDEVRKRHFLRHLYIKCIILPRQARDKHRQSTQKSAVFSQASSSGAAWVAVTKEKEKVVEVRTIACCKLAARNPPCFKCFCSHNCCFAKPGLGQTQTRSWRFAFSDCRRSCDMMRGKDAMSRLKAQQQAPPAN